MGCIWSRSDDEHINIEFRVSFSATLIPLFQHYRAVVIFLQRSHLFQHRSLQLEYLVATYLDQPSGLNPPDLKLSQPDTEVSEQKMGLCAIHATHKLHPLDFETDLVCQEWLIKACLKHQLLIAEWQVEGLQFQQAFRKYIQFLYLCYKQPTTTILPHWKERFMWHSHMQDNRNYKIDMIKTMGRVLSNPNDLTSEQIKTHRKSTINVRKMYLPSFRTQRHSLIKNQSSDQEPGENIL